jgi:hypothetical protein
VAAVLRVVGLGWGLRHPPHGDESAFVVNAHRMIAEGSLDHRYYEYPGLFFYVLAGVLRFVKDADPPAAASYLAARGLVAAFGVAAVALQFVFARRLVSDPAALFSSALLAVSLVAVQTAHSVRPDVALQALYLLALIALLRMDGGAKADVVAGAALGAAAALKFSGVFLVPAMIAARLLVPRRRALGLVIIGATAAAVFAVASPYSILHFREFVAGVETQVSYHYDESPEPELVRSYPEMAALYLAIWVKTLGAPAAVLSLAGLRAVARAPRRWIPLLVVPLVAIAVFASSQVRHDRFLLPAMVVGFALAAAGWELVRALSVRLAVLVAAVAIGLPLLASVEYVRDVSRPGTADRAIDWAAASMPAGARVLSRLDLGFDPRRVEVLEVPRVEQRVLVLASDFVFATDRDAPEALAGLVKRAAFEPHGRYNGPRITAYEVPTELRARLPLPPGGVTVSASSGLASLPALVDGDRGTWWYTDEIQKAGDFVSVDLGGAPVLAGVEMDLGEAPRHAAREWKVEIRRAGRWWSPPWREGRTRPEAQLLPASQLILLDPPQPAEAVRLTLTRGSGRRWGMAELTLWQGAP